MLPENQNRFRRAEGTELMLRMVAEAGFVRYSALKVLSYAVSAPTARNAETLVDAGGLKEVFPAFMGKGATHTKKTHGNDAAKDEEVRAVSIVASCMALLPHPQPPTLASGKLGDVSGAGSGVQRLRLLAKFKENAYEKVRRRAARSQANMHRALGRVPRLPATDTASAPCCNRCCRSTA